MVGIPEEESVSVGGAMGLEVMSQSSVSNLAREGDFRAIAYWLNTPLVPQGIYTRVAADRPGYLMVLVEFLRLPLGERLTRFICHRLCQLNSPLIKGVRIITRSLGSANILSDQTIRLYTPANGQQRRAKQSSRRTKAQKTNGAKRSAVYQLATQAATLGNNPRQMGPSQIALLGGSAAAAFLLGVGSEVLNNGPATVAGASANRPANVQTAQGSVRVLQAEAQSVPTDAPVTLTFGNRPAPSNLSFTVQPTPEQEAFAQEPTTAPEDKDSTVAQADVALTNLGTAVSAISVPSQSNKAAQTTLLSRSTLTAGTQTTGKTLSETLDALDQAGLKPVGAGRNADEARRPEIIDVRGQRIAYLGYADSDAQTASFWSAGTNPALGDRIAEDIQAIRKQVDWVVVSYHWNQQLASYPSDAQVQLAHLAIDQGADLVVGYNPEVLQGAEIYKGRAIAYSLGDFVFPGVSQATQTDYDTAMLKVALKDNQMRVEFVPVEVKQSNPTVATGEKSRQILGYLEKASALFKQPLQTAIVLDRQSTTVGQSSASQDAPAKESTADSFISRPDAPAATSDSLTLPEKTETGTTPDVMSPAKPSDSFITTPAAPSESKPSQPETDAAPETMAQPEERLGSAGTPLEQKAPATEKRGNLQNKRLEDAAVPENTAIEERSVEELPAEETEDDWQQAPTEDAANEEPTEQDLY